VIRSPEQKYELVIVGRSHHEDVKLGAIGDLLTYKSCDGTKGFVHAEKIGTPLFRT